MICIIPARGNSQRIPKKNIKIFHGKPIIAYSIETAKESELFDRIIVSTDSEEIADIATSYGAEIQSRSEGLEANNVGTQEVVDDVLRRIIPMAKMDMLVCCIYATAPLIDIDDLEWAHDLFTFDNPPSYAFSVGTNPLSDAGQFYWGRVKSFYYDEPLISSKTAMIPIADNRVCDINTMDDWNRAEKMYESLSNS